MATKFPNVRGGMPSVSDLLENPSIRALADRWNRNVVVSGVRSFLDELRTDLGRRGAEAVWPSLRELAERAARHIVASQQASQRPAINATGRFWGTPWIGRPQCEAALERAFAAGREFVSAPTQPAALPLAGDVESLICRITGAAAAVAVHSYAGGLWLALSAIGSGRDVIVSRGELGDVELGCPLSKLIASTGTVLKEIGSTNRTSAADYEAAVDERTAAVLTNCPDAFCVIGETASTELDELVALARDRELVLIDALGAGPLVDLPSEISWPDRSLQGSLAAGASLVLVRGDGLVGGPPCGILAGDRDIVRQITEQPLFAAWKLDPPRSAALAATLECHQDRSRGESGLPLIELLATPLENLRNRGERLAPQLALAEGVRSADVVSMLSHCDGLPTPDRAIRSFGVALSPHNDDIAALERRLTAAPEPVIGRIEADRLLLDLRTVLPRQDQAIVRALASPPTAAVSHDSAAEATPQG
ncbi:MAG: hypothetical protein WD669_09415 [Pirellulales bacterium]